SPKKISLFFPRAGATGVSFRSGSLLASNAGRVRAEHRLIADRGVVLSIPLEPPTSHAWVAGEVHLAWDNPRALPPLPAIEQRRALECEWNGCWPIDQRGAPIRSGSREDDEGDDDDWGLPSLTKKAHAEIERAVERLTPAQHREYQRRFRASRAI